MFVKENGKLLARVHENRGNILVYARVRPPTADEVAASDALEVVQILSDTGECAGIVGRPRSTLCLGAGSLFSSYPKILFHKLHRSAGCPKV